MQTHNQLATGLNTTDVDTTDATNVTLHRDGLRSVILALMVDGRQGSPLKQLLSVPLLLTQNGALTRLLQKATLTQRAASTDGHPCW